MDVLGMNKGEASSGTEGVSKPPLGLTLVTCLQCPGGTFTPSMKSTKDYPDEVINFMRSHPLMYQAVYPLQRRPLVVRTGAPYRLTTVAVDQVDAADGRYEVLFLGTGTHCCSQTLPRWARWAEGADPWGGRPTLLGVAPGSPRSTLLPPSFGARIAETRGGDSRETGYPGTRAGLGKREQVANTCTTRGSKYRHTCSHAHVCPPHLQPLHTGGPPASFSQQCPK